MDFEKILERYMRTVIDDDHVVADPDHHGVRGLKDDERDYLRELYRKLLDQDIP
jgi:hypothetical protein